MRFKISFFAVMLLLSLALSGTPLVFAPLCAAFVHECGHILAAKLCGVKLGKMDIGIFGARISISGGIYSYSDEIFVCAAGPLANLIFADAAAITLALSQKTSESLSLFIVSSFCLAAVNLLPIRSFDGGRILSALLCKYLSPKAAEATVKALSFISLFTLWSISLYLLLRTSASLSLFIFSVSVFANIFI